MGVKLDSKLFGHYWIIRRYSFSHANFTLKITFTHSILNLVGVGDFNIIKRKTIFTQF